MNRRSGLKTDLEFRFGVNDLEVPDLNFAIAEPPKKEIKKIIIIKKNKKRSKKIHTELF
jgi:hypothetical protein